MKKKLKFKYGDHVVIKKKGFFNNVQAIVFNAHQYEHNYYIVKLKHGMCPYTFVENKLKLIKGK